MQIVATYTRSLRVGVVFEAIDVFTGQPPLSAVSVRIAGSVQVPRLVDGRYIVFVDLPEGEYEVLVEARDYLLNGPVFFNPAGLNLLEETVTLNLEPRFGYPFPEGTTLLYGTIVDAQEMGVGLARVEVVGGPHDGKFTITDAAGRCALYFDESNASRNINLIVSKEGYENRAVTATIQQGQTVTFSALLDPVSGGNVAVVQGRVTDAAGLVVTQANVSVSPWGVSTLTDCDGRFLVEQSVTADESITLSISQAGFAARDVAITAIRGGVVDVPVVLNFELLPVTAGLGVEVVDASGFVAGALVEIIEKNRAALTNADGLTRFFFNDLNREQEEVSIRVSKTGFVERTVRRTIAQGRSVRQTVLLSPQ